LQVFKNPKTCLLTESELIATDLLTYKGMSIKPESIIGIITLQGLMMEG